MRKDIVEAEQRTDLSGTPEGAFDIILKSGLTIPFFYPSQKHMLNMVMGILEGKEYPIFPLRQNIRHVMFDIGAHIGAAALYFKNHHPDLKIYCFEPSRNNYHFLRKNILPLNDDIQAFPYGLHDHDGNIKLYQGARHGMECSVIPSACTSQDYEMIQLRQAISEIVSHCPERIAILKIDTEGCEIPILRNIAPILDRVDYIYIEYHSEEDRLEIDSMLSPLFVLCGAHTTLPHRGGNVYLSKTHAFAQYWEQRLKLPRG